MTSTVRARRLLVFGAAGLTLLLLLTLASVTLVTRAWAEDHRTGERLLTGTVVAGIDVGERTVEEATDAVAAELDARLDAELEITAPDRSWTTTPRELGTTADAPAAVAEAVDATTSTGWSDLAAVRWLDAEHRATVDVDLRPDDERIAIAVQGYAADIEREPIAASVRWTDGATEVVSDQIGRTVERQEAEQAITEAILGGQGTVELPVDEQPADVVASDIEGIADGLDAATGATLDRPVELVHGEQSWQVTAREIGAHPHVEEVLGTALDLAGEDGSAEAVADGLGAVPLAIDDNALDGHIEEIAGAVAVSPVNADIDYSSGWVEITGSSEGRALDRDAAREAALAALHGGESSVDLPTVTLAPERTREHFRDVLLVRQDERRLYHYRNGDIVDDWPVAVGTNDQPTPTGRFTVGHKRHMPTWHNPSPDGWGEDMPDMVEPGEDNPLGVRALNWNRGGADTLIRFHGTANTSSIGGATSNGCVRMTNDDVIDLYDRIPTGTPIVSVHS